MTHAPESPDAALVERLRANSAGYDEWRVQDPKDGSYCIAFSWPDVVNPEREAREWLADAKARAPHGRYATFEAARVHVHTTADKLMHEAADTITRLTAERDAARRDAERWRALAHVFHLSEIKRGSTMLSTHWAGWVSGEHTSVNDWADAYAAELRAQERGNV